MRQVDKRLFFHMGLQFSRVHGCSTPQKGFLNTTLSLHVMLFTHLIKAKIS